MAQRLVSADGSHATYAGDNKPTSPARPHLDELVNCIGSLEGQGFAKPLVHILDREGDSIGHIRRWETSGWHWLVRAKDNPKVEYLGKPADCKAVAQGLGFTKARQVDHHGKACWQWVAEAEVTITRPAKPSQKKDKKPPVPGIPVAARLVVSRVLSEDGEVLAEWLLLTNVKGVEAASVALWYY